MSYLIWKALHLIFMICWFAALFYLPRFFVYHAMAEEKQEHQSIARFIVMERKLYIIGHIGMGIMVISGAFILWYGGWAAFGKSGWLHAKLLLVALLIGYYIYCGRIMKAFARGENSRSHVFFRWFNEVPALFLVLITFLAILKPF